MDKVKIQNQEIEKYLSEQFHYFYREQEKCEQFADENGLLMEVLSNSYIAGTKTQREKDLNKLHSLLRNYPAIDLGNMEFKHGYLAGIEDAIRLLLQKDLEVNK